MTEAETLKEFEEWWNSRDPLIKDLVSDAYKHLCARVWLAAFRKYHKEVEG